MCESGPLCRPRIARPRVSTPAIGSRPGRGSRVLGPEPGATLGTRIEPGRRWRPAGPAGRAPRLCMKHVEKAKGYTVGCDATRKGPRFMQWVIPRLYFQRVPARTGRRVGTRPPCCNLPGRAADKAAVFCRTAAPCIANTTFKYCSVSDILVIMALQVGDVCQYGAAHHAVPWEVSVYLFSHYVHLQGQQYHVPLFTEN